jgi:4-alpha-glucanotransferase
MNTKERLSGILMPISSLPSPHGIGTLGKAAYDFVDFLVASHADLWQMLPLNVTSYGDSPYQSPSSNGLNYYFIDLDTLMEKGLLSAEEIHASGLNESSDRVDYANLFQYRIPLLKKAFSRFDATREDFKVFEQAGDYKDFAFYMTLKSHFGYAPWYSWEKAYRTYTPAIEESTLATYPEDYLFYVWTQYEFLNQYRSLKNYANSKGIRIIGDMPLYLALDSVEVYKYPQLFLLDKNLVPTLVAGCPPDKFSADGQLWGNPIYDWSYMAKDNYRWFHERIRKNLSNFDILRIDHFRGIAGYYTIPYGMKNARIGKWQVGPGFALFEGETSLPIIAEDLGFLDQPVKDLLKKTTYPGMKVLEFAFDGKEDNIFKPTNSTENYVCYTGTHDNMPIYGYLNSLTIDELNVVKGDLWRECLAFDVPYHDQSLKTLAKTIVSLCYAGKTFMSIVPIQDLLLLDNDTRMNHPSVLSNENWTYRSQRSDFSPELSSFIAGQCKKYHRGH